jgi:flagellar hook protein FlgE
MIGSLFTAISGLGVQKDTMTVIGDNIANVTTTAFKGSTVQFANLLNETTGGSGMNPGAGVALAGITEQLSQGSLEPTSNPTDLAISGDGYFQVRDGGATGIELFYTRAGNFVFDGSGYLVNTGDQIVQGYDITGGFPADPPAAAPVNIQVDVTATSTHRDYAMEDDGIITGINKTTGAKENLWQVSLFDFPNTLGLTKKGGNLYAQSNDSGAPLSTTGGVSGISGLGKVIAQNLEMSNVDIASEFSKMIVTQKAFQANAKVITTSDEILTSLIGMKR